MPLDSRPINKLPMTENCQIEKRLKRASFNFSRKRACVITSEYTSQTLKCRLGNSGLNRNVAFGECLLIHIVIMIGPKLVVLVESRC